MLAEGALRAQVNRDQLPRPDWSLKVAPSYVAPRNKLEREVQLLWQTVLNQPAMISVEADFTQQGGGMMHAVVVNGIIRHVPLPVCYAGSFRAARWATFVSKV